MTIVAAESVAHFFSEVVEDAMKAQGVEATDGATQYLVALLSDYAHPAGRTGEALDRPLTLLFDEAIRAADPGERFERLRTLGDGVLYGCGFFADHFQARGVDSKYLQGLGTRAYDAARAMLLPGLLRGPDNDGYDVFGELADKFGTFVVVLSDVADATIAMGNESPRGLLRVYERWLRTGNERLAGVLTSRGVMPTRGAKGTVQ